MKFSIRYRFAVAAAGLFAAVRIAAAPNPSQAVPDELDLRTAVQFALDNNFSIRQAQERIKQQEGVYIEVRAKDIPNVNLTYNYNQEDKNLLASYNGLRFGTPKSWTIALQATQNIYSGGGNRAAINSQKRTQEAAVLEMKGVINQALLQVRQNFYNVILAQKKIAVQEASLTLAEETLKNVQNRYDSGTVSRFELLRAKVTVANARPPLITAHNDYRIAVEQLRQALGFSTRDPENLKKVPKIVGELDYTPTQFELENALESARANRPELARFAKLEQARTEDITQRKSGYIPNLSASAGYEVTKDSASAFVDHTLRGWMLGVQGNWAIFDGAATRGRVIQARSLLEQAKLTTAEQQLSIDVEVRTAFSSWQEAVELVNSNKATVEQAEESLRLAESRFSAGTATQLDLLQARVDLTQARTNEIQAYYNYNVAVATLQKAIGQADSYADNLGAGK